MSPGRHLRAQLAYAAVLLGFVVAANIIVDPYDSWGWLRIRGFNDVKPDLLWNERRAKLYAAARLRPAAAVFGSSSAGHAIDVRHPAWLKQEGPRYNLALGGTNIRTTRRFFEHALAGGRLRQAVLGVDLFMFNAHRPDTPDLDPALLDAPGKESGIARLRDNLYTAPLWDTLAKTARTVLASRRGGPGYYDWKTPDGRILDAYYEEKTRRRGGYGPSFADEVRGCMAYLPHPAYRFSLEDSAGRSTIEEFKTILLLSQRHGVDLRVFISPLHAQEWECVEALGLAPEAQRWRRELALAAAQANVPLWDFSAYTGAVIEPIPTGHDAPMRWYWEPVHYKKELGDLVLDALFGLRRGFGVRLTRSNIERHLIALRRLRERYLKSRPPWAASLHARLADAFRETAPSELLPEALKNSQTGGPAAKRPLPMRGS